MLGGPVTAAPATAGRTLHGVRTVTSGPGADALAASAPDLLVVVAYGEILPQAVLGLPVRILARCGRAEAAVGDPGAQVGIRPGRGSPELELGAGLAGTRVRLAGE